MADTPSVELGLVAASNGAGTRRRRLYGKNRDPAGGAGNFSFPLANRGQKPEIRATGLRGDHSARVVAAALSRAVRASMRLSPACRNSLVRPAPVRAECRDGMEGFAMPTKAAAASGTALLAGALTTLALSLLGHPVSADVQGAVQTVLTAVLAGIGAYLPRMEPGS